MGWIQDAKNWQHCVKKNYISKSIYLKCNLPNQMSFFLALILQKVNLIHKRNWRERDGEKKSKIFYVVYSEKMFGQNISVTISLKLNWWLYNTNGCGEDLFRTWNVFYYADSSSRAKIVFYEDLHDIQSLLSFMSWLVKSKYIGTITEKWILTDSLATPTATATQSGCVFLFVSYLSIRRGKKSSWRRREIFFFHFIRSI